MGNITGFGNLPKKYSVFSDSKIVILPVPYDETSSWIKGADRGPEAVIESSANLELYDIETDSEVYKMGIFTDSPILENRSPESMIHSVKERVKYLIGKNKFVAAVGGEHSVSIGAFYAHKDFYSDMSVLQLDAHSDLREEYEDSKFNHACVMSRAKEICPITQVGIRSMDSSEKQFIEKDRIFYAEDIRNNNNWISDVISKLTTQVYITIDVDAFDISIMPSTGTPEPGGLLWYDVLALLKKTADEREIIGFDLVELCPTPYSQPYNFMAAKLIYKLLSYKFSSSS